MRPALVGALALGLSLGVSLSGCSSTPGPTQVHEARPAPEAAPDMRADATDLLHRMIAGINQQGSVRTQVKGGFGLVGELDAAGYVRYHDAQADVQLSGQTQMDAKQPQQKLDVAIVDGVGYVASPLLNPHPARPWLKVSDQGDFAAALLQPTLNQLRDSIDPRQAFQGAEASTKIQSRADETLHGQPVTRYELRVLTQRAAETSPDLHRREHFRAAAEAGKAELGYQLWVNRDGLPVQFAATQDVAQAGPVSLVSTYHDWGAPARVQAPPAEKIGGLPQGLPLAQPR